MSIDMYLDSHAPNLSVYDNNVQWMREDPNGYRQAYNELFTLDKVPYEEVYGYLLSNAS